MTRKECLDKAAECVLKDRASQYGKVENNFKQIADLWEAYLHAPISALDVAMMMSLLKIARAKANPTHADSFVDLAGYAACGSELAGAEKAFGKPDGGCCQNGNDQPEFNFSDKVQARLGDGVWRNAVVSDKEITLGKLYYTVKISDFSGYYSLKADDVRPAPKAEGCEALVEHDAPQTPAELYDKIIASNPATFGRPRTPTGEELAEMAEEDAHE